VRYFSRCREEQPQYQEMHDCLADVMAEKQTRRPTDRTSGTTLVVPRIRM